jgi:predicted transcriptional regulator
MEIRASILDCLITEDSTVNRIRRWVGLNQEMTKMRLDKLIALQFAERIEAKGWVRYSATAKGIKWVKSYRKIADEAGLDTSKRDRLDRDF